MTLAGVQLLRFLLEGDESKCTEPLQEFLNDLHQCFAQVSGDSPPPGAILAGSRLLSSQSAHYFLFIGQLSASNKGRKLLERDGFYEQLFQLVGSDSDSGGGESSIGGSACSISLNTHNDTYAKLIISCLHYGPDAPFSRTLLSKVLTGGSDNSRLYATNFLRVLLRIRLRDFRKWALELLITQLADKNQPVVSAALDILDEACESVEHLEVLVSLRPALLHLGDRGVLLIARFASTASGLRYLQDTGLLAYELRRWTDGGFQLRYARLAEQFLNDTFTMHVKGEDGTYGRRVDRRLGSVGVGAGVSTFGGMSGGGWRREAFTPPHLFGSLALHSTGVDVVKNERLVERLQRSLSELCCVDTNGRGEISRLRNHSELQFLRLKSVIWSIGHLGSGVGGLHLLQNGWILQALIRLANDSAILSIRAVCYYSLGLIGRSELGRQFLDTYGWIALGHTRNQRWPLCEQMLRGRLRSNYSADVQWSRPCATSVSSADTRLSEHLERAAGLNQSRDSVMFIDAEEKGEEIESNEVKSQSPQQATESVPSIETGKAGKTEREETRLRSSSDAPQRTCALEEDFDGFPRPDSSGANHFDAGSAVVSCSSRPGPSTVTVTETTGIDSKYGAIGSYSLAHHRLSRPSSQTLTGKKSTQRPHSQQHLSPFSSAPRRKISEPTGCANPSTYHSTITTTTSSGGTSGQCAACTNVAMIKSRTHNTFDECDAHCKSRSDSYADSSGSVRICNFCGFVLSFPFLSLMKFFFYRVMPYALGS